MSAIPAGDFKSTAMEVLWRVRASGVAEVPGRSMRRTDAPASASRRPAKGPACGLWSVSSEKGASYECGRE